MVVSQETLDALEELGLNMYERKIYAALVSRGVSTAGELSDMTNVPRSRAYDVLESLAEKGFVILKPSKPMEYVSVPPEEALENTKELHRDELETKLERIDRFKEGKAINELKNLYEEGVDMVDLSDMSGALKGRYNLYKHMNNMFKNADSYIKLMTTSKGLKDLHETHLDSLREAKDQGVDIKVMAPKTEDNKSEFESLSKICDLKEIDEESLDKTPNGRLTIVDGEKLAFSLTHDEVHPSQDTSFWSKSEHAASDAFGPMFDIIWDKAPSSR